MYNQQCMNDMYYYNIKLQSWVKIQYRNEPPSPRYGHTMEFFENSLYIFGGYVFENEKYTYTNDLLSFSLGNSPPSFFLCFSPFSLSPRLLFPSLAVLLLVQAMLRL